MLMISEKCPGCGQEVCLDDAPLGLCPRCLMRRGLDLADTLDFDIQSTPSGIRKPGSTTESTTTFASPTSADF